MISSTAQLDELQGGLAVRQRTKVARVDGLQIELLNCEDAAVHVEAWRALAAAPLEPNAFFEPGFALAAARHLTGGRPRFLFVWAGVKLVGICPLLLPVRGVPWSQLRVFIHPQIPLGVPLLDPAFAGETLAAILTYCGERLPHRGALTIPLLAQDGPTGALLNAYAKAEGRQIRRFAAYERPVLPAGIDPAVYSRRAFNARRRQKLNKARRMLATLGAVRFRLVIERDELAAATEEFLSLEAKGWKGRRGTALASSPQRAAFARASAAALAAEGKLLVGRLSCGAVPVAMGLVFKSGGRAFYWKTAHDEDYAPCSPGVLMSLDLTRALLSEPAIAMTDSCANTGQMIGHLWKERADFADLFVEIGADHKIFLASAAAEAGRRALRARLKSIVHMLRRVRAAWQKRPVHTI